VRRIILFLVLSAPAAIGQSQPKISLVQVTGNGNVFTAAQNAGDLNVFLASWNDDTTTITRVTDTAVNAYTQLLHTTTSGGGGLSQDIWYAANIKAYSAGNNTLEITTSTGKYMSYLRIHGFEYSGVVTSNAVNGTAIGSTGSSADPNPGGAVVTTAGSAMLFCATKSQLGDYVRVQPPGFTEIYSDNTSSVGDEANDALNVPPPPPGWYGCSPTLNASGAWITQLAGFAGAFTQNVTVNWTSLDQIIDGFGAADAFVGPLTSAQQDFFFGTASGQLGLSLLRTAVPDGSQVSGVCTTVNAGCAGPYVSDMKAMIANGGRIYSSPWTPPPAYKTNGLGSCTNNAGLITADSSSYGTWLANYVMSLEKEDDITLYALSLQNEPDLCEWYDSAHWTAAEIDSFVANNLGPTFSSDKLPVLIFVPEPSTYADMNWGTTCAGDASCNKYVGGVNWHDYDAHLSGTNTVTADPYPSYWAAGKKYWETEASCGSDFGPSFCQHGFNTDITDALDWAAVIDQRIAVDNANAWLYWWLIDNDSTDDQGLMAADGTVAQRAYILGQYARFVRPGYRRISATHLPEPQVSVSAYKDQTTNTLVIIATNYGSTSFTQEFTIANAPEFPELTPWITSASLSLEPQAKVAVTSNSFTFTLPAQSITTFVGTPTVSAATGTLKDSSQITNTTLATPIPAKP
jgi:glucuronoarabinoxylan endo-1,4-beta-xylanase